MISYQLSAKDDVRLASGWCSDLHAGLDSVAFLSEVDGGVSADLLNDLLNWLHWCHSHGIVGLLLDKWLSREPITKDNGGLVAVNL